MIKFTLLPILFIAGCISLFGDKHKQPNIIFILADDLGYGDLGSYGQKIIKTPRLDRMAAEGIRFTQHYAGSTVCAPSRAVLMTGKHMGNVSVRGNSSGDSFQVLKDEDVTVAEVLKEAGYTTGLIGKWGLGDFTAPGLPGLPHKQGFDYFFGYLNQVHAHNFYPAFLWRNTSRIGLPNEVKMASDERVYGGFAGGVATKKEVYSHDLFIEESLQWIRENKNGPFFLYLALTIPHANNQATRVNRDGAEVPDYGPYADKDWPNPDKGQAAMITRMDTGIGQILDQLKLLDIDENTLVIFSSDNGPHDESNHNLERFNPSGPLQGTKRALYEGGIRVPTLAWWPGTAPAGKVSDHISYFGDFMATATELAGAEKPSGLNSISMVPTLKGDTNSQVEHEYLYWEFYERGGRRAVRQGDWKAVRTQWHAPIELYDLSKDIGEQNDIADKHPEIVEKMEAIMEEAHSESEWSSRIPEK